MGLSASQARLLSLTSRMSDLELQAQMISNAKIRLADQGKLASQNYSDALNKQTLKVYSGVDDNGGTTYATATARNLTTYDAASPIDDKQRLIKDSAGRLVISGSVASAYAASGNGNNFEKFLNSLGFTQYSVNDELNQIMGNLAADVATLSDAMYNGVAEYVNLNDETPIANINNAETTLPDVLAAFASVNSAATLNTFKTSFIPTLTNALYGDIFDGVVSAANAPSAPVTTFKTKYTDDEVYNYMKAGVGIEGSYTAPTINDPNVVAFAQDTQSNYSNSYHYPIFYSSSSSPADPYYSPANSSIYSSDSSTSSSVGLSNVEFYSVSQSQGVILDPNPGSTLDPNPGSTTHETYNPPPHIDPRAAELSAVADNLWDNTTGSQYAQDSYGNSIGVNNNANDLQTVTNDTMTALIAILGGPTEPVSGNNHDNGYWTRIIAALATAQEATKQFYQSRLQSGSSIRDYGDNNQNAIGTGGTNLIGDEAGGYEEFYFDKNQVIKTFLDYFDAGCANIDDNDSTLSTTYSNQIGGGTTVRQANGGIGDTNIYNYSDVQLSDGTTAGHDGIDDAYLNNLRAAINAVNIENYAANHNAEKRWVPNNSSGMSSALAGIQATFSSITDYDNNITIPADLANASITAGAKTITLDLHAQLLAGLGQINVDSLTNTVRAEIIADRAQGRIKQDPGAVIYYTNIFNAIAEGGAIQESDENMDSPEWLQAGIKTGTLFLYTQAKQDDDFANVSWTSGDSSLSEESSDADVAKAEAAYKTATADIAAKDNRFDLQLKQLDTEHSAVKNEIDSVKKVIDKNIQSSFKIFDA